MADVTASKKFCYSLFTECKRKRVPGLKVYGVRYILPPCFHALRRLLHGHPPDCVRLKLLRNGVRSSPIQTRLRSEERRVGKEGRARCAAGSRKENETMDG